MLLVRDIDRQRVIMEENQREHNRSSRMFVGVISDRQIASLKDTRQIIERKTELNTHELPGGDCIVR